MPTAAKIQKQINDLTQKKAALENDYQSSVQSISAELEAAKESLQSAKAEAAERLRKEGMSAAHRQLEALAPQINEKVAELQALLDKFISTAKKTEGFESTVVAGYRGEGVEISPAAYQRSRQRLKALLKDGKVILDVAQRS